MKGNRVSIILVFMLLICFVFTGCANSEKENEIEYRTELATKALAFAKATDKYEDLRNNEEATIEWAEELTKSFKSASEVALEVSKLKPPKKYKEVQSTFEQAVATTLLSMTTYAQGIAEVNLEKVEYSDILWKEGISLMKKSTELIKEINAK